MDIVDVKVKVRRVYVEDNMGYGIDAVLEGVNLKDIVKSINTALVVKGSDQRVKVVDKK